jgi:hypothetical protein
MNNGITKPMQTRGYIMYIMLLGVGGQFALNKSLASSLCVNGRTKRAGVKHEGTQHFGNYLFAFDGGDAYFRQNMKIR